MFFSPITTSERHRILITLTPKPQFKVTIKACGLCPQAWWIRNVARLEGCAKGRFCLVFSHCPSSLFAQPNKLESETRPCQRLHSQFDTCIYLCSVTVRMQTTRSPVFIRCVLLQSRTRNTGMNVIGNLLES